MHEVATMFTKKYALFTKTLTHSGVPAFARSWPAIRSVAAVAAVSSRQATKYLFAVVKKRGLLLLSK